MSGKSNEHHPKPYCQEAGRLDGHWHGRRLAGAIPRHYLGYSEERQPGTVHLADDSGIVRVFTRGEKDASGSSAPWLRRYYRSSHSLEFRGKHEQRRSLRFSSDFRSASVSRLLARWVE